MPKSLLAEIEKEISSGATPEDVKTAVLAETANYWLATVCRSAASYLKKQAEQRAN